MRIARRLTAAALLAATVTAAPQENGSVDGLGRPFPAWVWRQEHLGQPLPAELLEPFGGTEIPREASSDWVVEAGAHFYVRHAPGRDALHLDRDTPSFAAGQALWLRERDPRTLARSPCLSNPAVIAELRTRLERSLSVPGRELADFVALGDEVGITPWGDPLDLCRSEHCEKAWRSWRADNGSRFGLTPTSERPSTDEVLLDPTPELWATWLAARAFQREVLSTCLLELTQRARAVQPDVPVALLGLIGETAFGGVDLEPLLATVDVFEPYPVADALERVATARALTGRPHTILATVFVETLEVETVSSEIERLAGGPIDGVVLWSDRALSDDSGVKDALGASLTAVRERRRAADRDPRGVAWIASDDSLAHAWLGDARQARHDWWRLLAGHQERHGTYEKARTGWFEEQRAKGNSPGSIDISNVGAEVWPRFRKLAAIGLTVVTDDELEGLSAFVEAGGTIEVREPFATLRPDGSTRPRATRPAWAR